MSACASTTFHKQNLKFLSRNTRIFSLLQTAEQTMIDIGVQQLIVNNGAYS
jgi:hypothetical protein